MISIALSIKGSHATSVYTEAQLRREARHLAGRDAIVATHVAVAGENVTLVVEHRNRAGAVTVSRCTL